MAPSMLSLQWPVFSKGPGVFQVGVGRVWVRPSLFSSLLLFCALNP